MALDNWRSILGEGGSLPRKDNEAVPILFPLPNPNAVWTLIGLCEGEGGREGVGLILRSTKFCPLAAG